MASARSRLSVFAHASLLVCLYGCNRTNALIDTQSSPHKRDAATPKLKSEGDAGRNHDLTSSTEVEVDASTSPAVDDEQPSGSADLPVLPTDANHGGGTPTPEPDGAPPLFYPDNPEPSPEQSPPQEPIPEAPPERIRIYVDYYMEACSSWEGQLFCHRVSDDGENWEVDYDLYLQYYEWGYRYIIDGHYAPKDPRNDSSKVVFKVDDVISQEPVDPFTRFDLTVDPSYSEQGLLEHIAVYSTGDRIIGGSITTRPYFGCYPEECETLGVKLDGEEPFVVTFEYNANRKLFAVETDGQVPHGLPSELATTLHDDWESTAPSSYVARDCFDSEPTTCTLSVVEDGVVTSVETLTQDADQPWSSVELTGEEISPVERLFEHLSQGQDESLIYDYQLDHNFNYVSRIDYSEGEGRRSHAIDCFVPDSVDAAVCRE